MIFATRIWLMTALVVCAVGCTPAGPQYFPVSGKVLVNDEPLKTGIVVFIPDADAGNTEKEEFRGIVKDGSYSITSGEKDGAIAGAYKVTVSGHEGADSTKMPTPLVDEIFFSPNTSGLKVVVKANAPAGAYDFKVTK